MKIKKIERSSTSIALIQSDEVILKDIQSSLDLVATINYETGCHRIAVNKEAVAEDFFHLSTGLAGDILQKFINYQVKFAIIGDFSHYTSQALKDFIYECNQGKDIFFVATEEEAMNKLSEKR